MSHTDISETSFPEGAHSALVLSQRGWVEAETCNSTRKKDGAMDQGGIGGDLKV